MNDAKLILSTERLKRGCSPELWDEFVRAFAGFTETVRDHCISSIPEDLRLMQGRAQQCGDVLRLLEGKWSKTAEKLEAKNT